MPESKCTGNCLKCSFQQQTYCAAQKGYAIMTYMPAIIEKLNKIEAEMPKFNADAVFDPTNEETAQKDSGAENRESKP